MNPAIASLVKMLGIDPQQLEQMVNSSSQILADFDNRLKLTLAGIEELKEAQKRDTAQILTLLEGLRDGRSSQPSPAVNGSAGSSAGSDLAPGRSGIG